MNCIWFVSTAKKNHEKTLEIGSRLQTKTSSPNGIYTFNEIIKSLNLLDWNIRYSSKIQDKVWHI